MGTLNARIYIMKFALQELGCDWDAPFSDKAKCALHSSHNLSSPKHSFMAQELGPQITLTQLQAFEGKIMGE